MRTVNEAFVLPNPPSWHEKIRKSIAKAVTGSKRLFRHRKEEAIRVSRHNQNYTARIEFISDT